MIHRVRRPSCAATCSAAALLLSCATATSAGRSGPPLAIPDASIRTGVSPAENPFVHAAGTALVDGEGRRFVPKGLAFGNQVWMRRALPRELRTEEDYRRSEALGVNAIRFYLNYRWFESDRTPYTYDERGFAWLAQNLAWASAHGIRLLLNLHVPQGGFQSAGGGRALWTEPENQRRFVALWREIARRYRDEPSVLGYDLLNEPVVTTSIGQWEELARATVAAIRAEDPRHLVVIERVNGVHPAGWLRRIRLEEWNPNRNGDMNFFAVNDTNVMYEFHFYQPFQFTLRGWPFFWVQEPGAYPGEFMDWDGQVRRFDRGYMEAMLAPVLAFQQRHQVPLYLGEFGVRRDDFEAGRNGEGWVRDVLDLAQEHDIGVSYHCFDAGDPLGLGSGGETNQVLAELLASRFR
jgi:hypothetical protein